VGATVLALTSALAIVTAPAASANRGPDLSSRAAIDEYLISIGVDPSEAVWQEGLRNYAGASCPGVGWNCVPADVPIVQIAAPLGSNVFSCTGLDCVAVQVALGAGQNDADCERGDKHADDAVQTCLIAQANTTGNNNAVVNQSIEQKGAVVTARQVARIEQTNESGKNLAGFRQVINQSSQVTGTVQSQQAHQAATLDQETTTGSNTSTIDQRQNQTQKASGTTDVIEQRQNTVVEVDPSPAFVCDRPEDDPDFGQPKNQCVDALQNSSLTAGGDIDLTLRQLIRESQSASNAPAVDQEQGSLSGLHGQEGSVVQNSSAPVFADPIQETIQGQTATAISGGVNPGDQFKDTGDPRCCATQIINMDSAADITQRTNQSASSDGAIQVARFSGNCESSGSCHVFQSATIDGDTDTNECTDTDPPGICEEEQICTEVVGESEETETQCLPPPELT
jgi:hypothetical protein